MTESDLLTELFDEFWAGYPVKKGKGAARKAYEKALKGNDKRELHKDILLAIEAQKRYRNEAQSAGEFIPQWKHPATWINQECWYDEIKSHAELRQDSQPPTICEMPDCSEPVHVTGRCAYHYCQTVPYSQHIVSFEDIRAAALKRTNPHTYIQDCIDHCRKSGFIK